MYFDYAQYKQRGSVHLLLILVLVILFVGGGIYFFQSQKKTEKIFPVQSSQIKNYNNYDNYDNYSNQSLGLTFKYSKELTVKEDSEEEFNKRGNGDYRKNFKGYVGYEPGKFVGAAAVLDKSDSYDANPLSVWVFNNENNLTVDAWFKDYWYYPFLWGVFDWTSKGHVAPDSEATISGQPARSRIVSYQPGKPKFMYISNNGKMYLFRVVGETGDKILSTFKFLEPEK